MQVKPNGMIVMSVKEYGEVIWEHERVAMKTAIVGLAQEFLKTALIHQGNLIETNPNRAEIISSELLERHSADKPENLHS